MVNWKSSFDWLAFRIPLPTSVTSISAGFQPGDRLPVNFEFTGEDFEMQPQHPPLELVAKRHGFVRIGANGIRTSPDADHFDSKPSQPGSFRVGFGAVQGKPAKLDVVITAPRR